MNYYELIPAAHPNEEYGDREEYLAAIKKKTPEPRGPIVLQIAVIIMCVFLSLLIYGTFNIESIP